MGGGKREIEKNKKLQKNVRAKMCTVFKALQFSSSLCNITGARL